MPSLREIEKTVASLWLNEEAREWLCAGSKGERPAILNGAPDEVLNAVDRKGVELYGGLLQFGHHDVMDSVYPYCARILDKRWFEIVEDYLRKFPPQHFNFNRLCSRFPEYVTVYGGALLNKRPWLAELADYEWIELEKMELNQDIIVGEHTALTTPEQIGQYGPLVNPTVSIRRYEYNIPMLVERLESRLSVPNLKPDPTAVAVFRHPEEHSCKFIELGNAAATIVELAQTEPKTYQQLLPLAVALTPDLEPQDAVTQFLELIEELQELFVFVGSKKLV